MSVRTIQRTVKRVAYRTGISKPITPRVLRYTFGVTDIRREMSIITFHANGQVAAVDFLLTWNGDGAILKVNLSAEALRTVPDFAQRLYQNFPNPFNPETCFPYQLAEAASVTIIIYDLSGRQVRHLSLGRRKAEEYLEKDTAAYWDGRNNTGESISSGMYFYHLQAGDFTATKRKLILK